MACLLWRHPCGRLSPLVRVFRCRRASSDWRHTQPVLSSFRVLLLLRTLRSDLHALRGGENLESDLRIGLNGNLHSCSFSTSVSGKVKSEPTTDGDVSCVGVGDGSRMSLPPRMKEGQADFEPLRRHRGSKQERCGARAAPNQSPVRSPDRETALTDCRPASGIRDRRPRVTCGGAECIQRKGWACTTLCDSEQCRIRPRYVCTSVVVEWSWLRPTSPELPRMML
jgi:hypothetical protein